MNDSVYDLLRRYADDYSWAWDNVRRVINRRLDAKYTTGELQQIYAELHKEDRDDETDHKSSE